LNHLVMMAQDSEQPYKVALEVREARWVRGLSGTSGGRRIGLSDRSDLSKVDTREKDVEQTKSF
jgi:hypothetical protein